MVGVVGVIVQPDGVGSVTDTSVTAPGLLLCTVASTWLVWPAVRPSGAVRLTATAGCGATVSGRASCDDDPRPMPVAGTCTVSRCAVPA